METVTKENIIDICANVSKFLTTDNTFKIWCTPNENENYYDAKKNSINDQIRFTTVTTSPDSINLKRSYIYEEYHVYIQFALTNTFEIIIGDDISIKDNIITIKRTMEGVTVFINMEIWNNEGDIIWD